ncbi:hypothetical protein ABID59_000488 [Bradyrhizobium sp. S3.3.6]|uniref:hypothetical protein n=1 Tax=Bradyrhizobium sp. S3.3.6 TaxID=3156429 RepID=UPI003391D494
MPTVLERAIAGFTARSSKRNAAIDGARIASLAESIDAVIAGLIAERTGLIRRVKRLLDEPETLAKWSSASNVQPSKSELKRVENRLRSLDLQLSECRHIEGAIANLRGLTGGTGRAAGV